MGKRHKLIDARNARGMTQAEVSQLLDTPLVTYQRWENGQSEPQPYMIQKLLVFFGVSHPRDLDLHSAFKCAPSMGEILEMLGHLTRRQFANLLAAFAGIDIVTAEAVMNGQFIGPSSLFYLSRNTIASCWNLLESGSYFEADNFLIPVVSQLDPIAKRVGPSQNEAASLALEATIIQMIIATHVMSYQRRVSLGESAVNYGQWSGNDSLYILALGWHGNTFTNCYQDPRRAIDILSKGVPLFNRVSPLNQTDISTELSKAYALNGDATNARNYVEQARSTMPDNPESSPLYQMTELGHAELDTKESKTYLILAKNFPDEQAQYGQLAYDVLAHPVSSQISTGTSVYRLFHKAESAILIGEMDEHLKALAGGTRLAFQINSLKQQNRARVILANTPNEWRTDERYEEISHLLLSSPTTIASTSLPAN